MAKERVSRQGGFTLMEMVIVIGIIAVLAGILLPQLTGFLRDSRTQANEANIQLLQAACNAYYNANREYPVTAGGQVDQDKLIAAGYISKKVVNPCSNAPDYTIDPSTGVVSGGCP
ncbi:MAG: type II secretion system protein [Alicyclobacillaceae bacterium]|nr:type II secretion system protein [Alicyclobacillaceae bacterium]